MEKKRVYLDDAATTMVSGEVLNEMMPYFSEIYGNANSLHKFGRDASRGVDHARDIIANSIGAKSGEIYFTSGGTEANNWAMFGIATANKKKGKHIIVSSIEHHSILASAKELEKRGFEVTYLPVDSTGMVNLIDLLHELRPDTILVSIMAVNNEVGTIQNVRAIGETLRQYQCYFHVDAVQAMGVLKFDVDTMCIDAMTMSSHKIHGPKGVGALYVRSTTPINKLIFGGEQEFNKRGGTTNVPAIVGFGKAMEITVRDRERTLKKTNEIANYFMNKLQYAIPDIHFNGNMHQKAPGIVNVSFDYVEGESILMLLDLAGIAVSTGSACASGSLTKSHVLKAMHLSNETINGAVRFSFGAEITKDDIDYVVDNLIEVVNKLRELSPLTKKRRKK